MSCPNLPGIGEISARDGAKSNYDRRLFTEDAHSLYRLSFQLTANYEKAERCFVDGIDECVDKETEWSGFWVRRIIIRNAIRMMAPHPSPSRPVPRTFLSAGEGDLLQAAIQKDGFVKALMVEDFERFVYVLSVLEGYSDQNCAFILGTSQLEIREARFRAMQLIADFDWEKVSSLRPCKHKYEIGENDESSYPARAFHRARGL